jgi:hypothetical protein
MPIVNLLPLRWLSLLSLPSSMDITSEPMGYLFTCDLMLESATELFP